MGYVERREAVVMEKSGRADSSLAAEMDNTVMYYFRSKYPDIVNARPVGVPDATKPLIVSKFWTPWQVPETPKSSFMINTCDVDPGGLWVGGLQHGIPVHGSLYHVDLTNFTSKLIPLPDDNMPMQIKTTPDALYMLYDPQKKANEHSLARYDLKSAIWKTRPLSDFFAAQLCEAGGALYFFVTTRFAGTESSIVRYDWDADKWNILASSRRRPARNQFDDAPPIVFFTGIFTGPNHQPCLCLHDGVYYIREDEGAWPEVFDRSFSSRAITVGDRTLVYTHMGEAVMLDANAKGPEYWSANTTPHVRKASTNGNPPEKVPTPWAAQAHWILSANKGSPWMDGVGFHNDEMFILEPPGTDGTFHLLCYSRKDAVPRRIPLQFHLDDQARAAFAVLPADETAPSGMTFDEIEHPQAHSVLFPIVTHQGLCFRYTFNGFWFLPFRDINAYLDAASN